MSKDDDRSLPSESVTNSESSSDFGSVPEYQPLNPEQVLENVLENVFCFLSSRSDRNAASLVCRSWYRVEALTRSELFIGNCYAVSPRRATSRFTRIQSVTLKGKPRFIDLNLLPPCWGAYFAPWVSAMAKAYPWLEKVHLKRMNVTNDDLALIAESFLGLREFVLACCDGFGTSGLAMVASRCRQLRVLELIDCEVSDDEVDWISYFPEGEVYLEFLMFDCVECLINFDALERLVARSHSLKELWLNRHVSIGQLYHFIVRAPQLTHLWTGAFGPLLDVTQGEQKADYLSAFAACKSLVSLSGFRDIVPYYLPAIYPVCANLTSLDLSCANVTAEHLKPIISNCHRLKKLWVLDSICDDGLQAVAATCKELQKLWVLPIDDDEDGEGHLTEVGLQSNLRRL